MRESLSFAKHNLASIASGGVGFGSFSPDEYPLLNRYLNRLYLDNCGAYITWDWNYDVGFVGLNELELKKAVFPELRKPRPGSLAEFWLLLVSGSRLSQGMGMPNVESLRSFSEVNAELPQGCFDKVYIFQYMYDRILRWTPAVG